VESRNLLFRSIRIRVCLQAYRKSLKNESGFSRCGSVSSGRWCGNQIRMDDLEHHSLAVDALSIPMLG
jgi:hypothetical protein